MKIVHKYFHRCFWKRTDLGELSSSRLLVHVHCLAMLWTAAPIVEGLWSWPLFFDRNLYYFPKLDSYQVWIWKSCLLNLVCNLYKEKGAWSIKAPLCNATSETEPILSIRLQLRIWWETLAIAAEMLLDVLKWCSGRAPALSLLLRRMFPPSCHENDLQWPI